MPDRLLIYQGYTEPVLVPDITPVTIDSWFFARTPARLELRGRPFAPGATVAPVLVPPPPPPPNVTVAMWDSPLRSRPQPWRHVPFGAPAGGATSVEPIVPVPVNRTGRARSLIRRTPQVLLPSDAEMKPDPEARREGRNWEIMTRIINSLLRQGALYQDPDDRNLWKVASTTIIDGAGNTVGPTGTFTDSF